MAFNFEAKELEFTLNYRLCDHVQATWSTKPVRKFQLDEHLFLVLSPFEDRVDYLLFFVAYHHFF